MLCWATCCSEQKVKTEKTGMERMKEVLETELDVVTEMITAIRMAEGV